MVSGWKRARWGVTLFVVMMVCAAFLVRPASVWGSADPEPTINPNIEYHIEPGPGWPAGYVPPAPPTELPARFIEDWETEKEILGKAAPQYLEMRVLSPMPNWTKEYPFLWSSQSFICGSTRYYYFIPVPDQKLLQDVYGDGHMYALGSLDESQCTFTPVTTIRASNATPEDKEDLRLRTHLSDDFRIARLGAPHQGGLNDCSPYAHEGAVEGIYVCFNNGNASDRFDAPAFLDLQAKRVRVPVRFLSEMMGANVTWDEPTQTVTIRYPSVSREIVRPESLPGFLPSDWIDPETYVYNGRTYRLTMGQLELPDRTIVLTIGKNEALVDGKPTFLDAPPVIVPPGRTMVPVRFVSEVMGAKVYWVGRDPIWKGPDGALAGTYQVHIYTQQYPFFEYPSWFLETRAQRQ